MQLLATGSRAVLRLLVVASMSALSCACATKTVAGPPTHALPAAVAAPTQKVGPLVAGPVDTPEQTVAALKAHYTKHEFRIPMRDGVHLHTMVYTPKDVSHSYPIMLQRTPYACAPYGVDNYPSATDKWALRRVAPSANFIKDGFILVAQDVRGRMMSEGTFVDVRPISKTGPDETTDAWDTVDWLVKNIPRNNGRVGVYGISYPGFYAAQAAVNAHPAVKAVSPQAPVTDWFAGDDFHHNGAFFLADAFGFLSSFGKPRPKPTTKATWGFDYNTGDLYEFFLNLGPLSNANKQHLKGKIVAWNDMMAHGNLDAFWQARNSRPHYRDAKPAVMTVGGWYDAEDLFGTLKTYQAFESQSPRANNTIVMGPWKHGGWEREDGDAHGDVTFGQKTSLYYREQVELAWFKKHLKQTGNYRGPEALMFETGTNVWRSFKTWPPRQTHPETLMFAKSGKLMWSGDFKASEPSFDAYHSDPNKPVPYLGKGGVKIDKNYMSADQRFASRRPDVLTYRTAAVDHDVTLAGPLRASVWVTTTGTDMDLVVKLIDVYPSNVADRPNGTRMAGYQQLVRAEVMRGKFRDSLSSPKPFTPGQPTKIEFELPDVLHTFRAGHRIMVQVQSSWFPLVDRNPQTFVDIYQAKPSDFRSADIQVHRSADKPSSLLVHLLPAR